MKLHRFFGTFDFRRERLTISDSELVGQWREVLRFQSGSEIILCDGKLNEALTRIISFKKNAVEVEILSLSKNENEPEQRVTLYCSILKGEHFELVAEKVTELGVAEIVPLICGRTVKQNVRPERLSKILKEAAEQSGRGVIPMCAEPMPLMIAMRRASVNEANFFLDPSGKEVDNFSPNNFQTNKLGIFIGPEGGWVESEIALAKKSGFHIVSLGKLTLRAETAAIVAAHLGVQGV